MRLLQQLLGEGLFDVRQVHLERNSEAEAAAVDAADRDVGDHFGVVHIGSGPASHRAQRGVETGGVAGGEQQLRVRSPAGAAQFDRDPDVGVDQTVLGADVAIAAVTRGDGGSGVESFHVCNCMWHNRIVQNVIPEATAGYEQLLLDRQLCFPLYAASRAVTAQYGPLLAGLGLTYPQYLVMLVLWEESPVTVSALGERLRLDSGTLSPLLKRLQAAGLVERRRDATDERRVLIELTPSGRALREPAAAVPAAIAEALGLDEQTYRELKAQLSALLCRLTPGV